MTTRHLVAYANGARMGTVTDENDIWSFTYEKDWLDAPAAFSLSPTFPLRAEPFVDGSSNRPVQWFFDNLLPEESMRTALAREAGVEQSDAWGLLAYYGRESAGALTLLAEGEQESAPGLKPLPFGQLEARIQGMPQRVLTADAPKRMSAAGAQPKLLLTMTGEPPGCELFEPVGNEPSMHLLKPDSRGTGYPHAAINEFFCMRLARAMALPVPSTHFLRVPTACYIIDRFDRDTTTEPVKRLHVVDTAQLLNYSRDYKYEQMTAQKLREAIDRSATRAATRVEVFRWSIFNVLIGNADAHLKNMSFYVTRFGTMLAPFYDLVSTVVYHTETYQPERSDKWPNCELAVPIGEATHFADITRANMVTFGTDLGLPVRGAEKFLDDMLAVLDQRVADTRTAVDQIAQPLAGEARVLNAILAMPLVEMSRALAR